MNRTTMRLAGLTLLGALAVASEARAVDANTISAVDVSEKDGAVELVIKGSRAPSYTVFKLQEPPRLVVDLSGADGSGVASPVEVAKGGVIGVSTAQYKDAKSQVGRVIVALDGPRRYEVQPRGDAVVVRVLSDVVAADAAAAPAVPAVPAATPAIAPPPAVAAPAPREEPKAAAKPEPTPAARPEPAV